MALIRKDSIGLYVFVDGWVARPECDVDDVPYRIKHNNKLSKFKEGDTVRGYHPAGTEVYLRVGKKGTNSYYMEIWSTYSLMSSDYKPPEDEE